MERRTFSNDELQQCWSLWRKGFGFSDIVKALNSKPGTIFGLVQIHGGYTPPERSRSRRHLSLSEREEVSRGYTSEFNYLRLCCCQGSFKTVR
jgi:hypothetical protein